MSYSKKAIESVKLEFEERRINAEGDRKKD